MIQPQLISSPLEDLIEFTEGENFQKVIKDLYDCNLDSRYEFVKNILLNRDALNQRGVIIPEGISIQRSYFFDGRSTLFCVVKYLKDSSNKVTITFYN
jgi:hypothetical protein